MAETQKDINSIINVGGALTHYNGVSGGGGEMVMYDSSPIGGPPSSDFSKDVRAPLSFTLTTRVVGATQAARDAFVARFNRGEVFDCKETPAGNGDMKISGEPDAIGKRFVVQNRTPGVQFQQNMELTILLLEVGPTPAA